MNNLPGVIKHYKLNIFLNQKPVNSADGFQVDYLPFEQGFNFDLIANQEIELSNIYIDFVFSDPILQWRNFDYKWVSVKNQRLISNYYSPKVIKLASDIKVVAINTTGCWEYIPENGVLRWHLVDPMLNPTMIYEDNTKRKFIYSRQIKKGTIFSGGFLWTTGQVEEFSRTPIGFKPIICFTDHCDFDTDILLKRQVELFEENHIKTSKGFFLFDYSHKENTSSFENETSKKELIQWEKCGHELVYHALSQSYRGETSVNEFADFESPESINPVKCYIDHGYHKYNFTQQKTEQFKDWYSHIQNKGVNLIWNYIDSGEGNYFTINQINPEAFTLKNIFRSRNIFKRSGYKRSLKTDMRNFIMYGVDEDFLMDAKKFAGNIKTIQKHKSIRKLIASGFNFVKHITDSVFWKNLFELNKPFEYSKFCPVFYNAINQENTNIQVFQSVAIRDFDLCFSEQTLTHLINEKGILIAHTYFSYLGSNHEGRLFQNKEGAYRQTAKEGFERVGKKISEQEIWNPTISQMLDHFNTFKEIKYQIENNCIVITNLNVIKRTIE